MNTQGVLHCFPETGEGERGFDGGRLAGAAALPRRNPNFIYIFYFFRSILLSTFFFFYFYYQKFQKLKQQF